MPLLDHFCSPLYPQRHWESLFASWSHNIMARLNEGILPKSYYGETNIHIGGRVEQKAPEGVVPRKWWTPPIVFSTVFPDEIEIRILSSAEGTGEYLVAAIEMVSPGNKDRPETRKAFAAKCSSYLQLGIGLIIVDVVTERAA